MFLALGVVRARAATGFPVSCLFVFWGMKKVEDNWSSVLYVCKVICMCYLDGALTTTLYGIITPVLQTEG